MNTTGSGRRALDMTTSGPGSPRSTVASPASSSARPAPTTTARCSSAARVAASDQPTSAGVSSGRPATHDRSRPACAASPSAVPAETGHTPGGQCCPGGTIPPCPPLLTGGLPAPPYPPGEGLPAPPYPPGEGLGAPPGGACSRITCALVPEIPNDDTAARRGLSSAWGQSAASAATRTLPADQSTCLEGASTCSVLGMRARRI